MSQCTGLNAVSPSNRSMASEASFEKRRLSLRPKNSELFAREALTPLGVGSLRVSKSEKFFAVTLRKMSWPMIGMSPFNRLCS